MAENENTENTENETESEERQPGAPGLSNPLSKPTDAVARPGFRNAPNKGSKAQKKRKKKRR